MASKSFTQCKCSPDELKKFKGEGFNSHLSASKLAKACAAAKCKDLRKRPKRESQRGRVTVIADDPWRTGLTPVPGQNAGTDEIPYLPGSREGQTCSSIAPAVIWKHLPITVGRPADPGQIWNNSYEGLLVSECHYRLRNGAWSDGGPFYVFKRSVDHGKSSFGTFYRNFNSADTTSCGVSPSGNGRWTGPVPPGFVPYEVARDQARDYYSEAYRKARPGNPKADVGQFLIELRDLPVVPLKGVWRQFGSLVKRNRGRSLADLPVGLLKQLSDFRSLGSEYLNVVFGWKPFLNDLRKTYNLWQVIDKQMAQIIRENGKNIRRRCQVKDQKDVSQVRKTYPWPYADVFGAPPNWFGEEAYSVRTTVTRVSERVWFSGSFRYYIPDVGSSQWDARARLALFGAFPTPELLWSVLPWSWLIDWFANVSDVLSNISPNAVDNLVCNRSFIMRHTVQEIVEQCDTAHDAFDNVFFGFGAKWNAFSGSFVSTDKVETKVRAIGGNPYGLNSQWSDLSSNQVAVLAALGLSRASITSR